MKLLKRKTKTRFAIKIPYGPHEWRFSKNYEYNSLGEAIEALDYYNRQVPQIVEVDRKTWSDTMRSLLGITSNMDMQESGSYTVLFSDKYTNICPKCGKICCMECYGDLEDTIYIASCKNCDVLFIDKFINIRQ